MTAEPPRGLFAGLCTIDLVHRLSRLPAADEKVTALSQELAAGGPAAIAALTFAALGGISTLVTGLGAHPLAEVARRDLAANGVTVHDLADHADAPSISAVRVHDRGRRPQRQFTGRRHLPSPWCRHRSWPDGSTTRTWSCSTDTIRSWPLRWPSWL